VPPGNFAPDGGSRSFVGGLVGHVRLNSSIYIEDVTLAGRIFGRNHVGGFVGFTTNTSRVTVTDSTFSGAVNGRRFIGGILGRGRLVKSENNVINGELNGRIDYVGGNNIGGLVGRLVIRGSDADIDVVDRTNPDFDFLTPADGWEFQHSNP
jgi:hypothetical protein